MRDRDVSLNRLSDTMWEIPRSGGMRVPGLAHQAKGSAPPAMERAAG